MSSYTLELRKVCDFYGRDEVESWFKDYNIEDYLLPTQVEVIKKANLFSKDKLASLIVDHYYMREIGYETPMLFKHFAKVYMKEIMERKLPLIYSNNIEYDPLVNIDFTETFEREATGSTEGTSNSTSNSSSNGMNINNDTPQGNVTKQNIETGAFASSVSQSETASNINDNTSSSSNGSNKESYTRKQKGNSGSITTVQNLIKQFREIIVDIDEEIIEELNKLFIGLY